MPNYRSLFNLVIVPGHAVYLGKNKEDWAGTFGYSREYSLYIEHIRAGVTKVNQDDNALLMFTGGQTRLEAGPVSEAEGYRLISEQNNWFGFPEVEKRTVLEEYARDSFENLDFSLLLFRKLTGNTPSEIRVYGFSFKRKRFEFHALTLGISNFIYVPVNNPPEKVLREKSIEGEERTLRLFKKNPFGDTGELLQKRLTRDPYQRGNPYC